jgi:hypothetical protein
LTFRHRFVETPHEGDRFRMGLACTLMEAFEVAGGTHTVRAPTILIDVTRHL